MFTVIVNNDSGLNDFYYEDKRVALEVAKALALVYRTGVFISVSDENCFVVGEP